MMLVVDGRTALSKSLAALNVPAITKKCFTTIQSQIGDMLKKELEVHTLETLRK